MNKARPSRKFDFAQSLKKIILSTFVVFTFVAYAIHDRLNATNSDSFSQDNVAPLPAVVRTTSPKGGGGSGSSTGSQVASNPGNGNPFNATQVTVVSQPTLVPTNQPTATSIPLTNVPPTNVPAVSAPTATPKGQYRDGQYTGSVADAFYGNVQVKAIIQGGKLTDVQWLDYPRDRRTSQQINRQATPWLKQEAIQAQSAQVDFISGATLTSQAFVQSLQYALNQAAN